jgi:hypothetical protein
MKFRTLTETAKGALGAAGCREKRIEGPKCHLCAIVPPRKSASLMGPVMSNLPMQAYSGVNNWRVRIESKRSSDGLRWTPSRRCNG